MLKFIDKLAKDIFEKGMPLEDLVIVLPSERAIKYLQKALFTVYGKPVFSPEIITMNRWIYRLSDKAVIDSTRALFKLYDIHLKVDQEEKQSLDEFLKWGRILLSDFDEIDRYLIDSENLFRDLTNIKEIENWSFGNLEELTEGQKRYMRFWDLLKLYYSEFNLQLENDGECYMGAAYKSVAENIKVVFEKNRKAHFVFAGFNALSPAEISIMKQLYSVGRADIYIDADRFYLDDKNHEAGSFIRDLIKILDVKTLPFISDNLRKDKKNITLINCKQPTGQAKVSATILNKYIAPDEFSDTLLLLADESLIVPVIKNIPVNVNNANITIGLPLKNTSIRTWVELLFNVQEHAKFTKGGRVYHKDFIGFMKHPFITGYCNTEEQKAISKIELDILKNNWSYVYINQLGLSERLMKLIQHFFKIWNISNGSFPIEYIRELNRIVYEGLNTGDNKIERAIIYQFDSALIKLGNILDEFKPNINLGTFKSLFNQHWMKESVAYYGNPLDDLQIMGLLETRLLDFKNIVVVGLNEGSMPPTNAIQSMIMMDLRKYHNLPTPREKQGLFAHHFYRLLHYAENVWITYSSANREQKGMGEPSRYILQLQLELSRLNPNIEINNLDYTISNEDEQAKTISVAKTEALLLRLDAYFLKGTSASALNTAMQCTLDFYYKYLIGVGQEDKVEEEIEVSTFGNFIHKTLQILYQDFSKLNEEKGNTLAGRSITALDLNLMLESQKGIMKQQYDAYFHIKEGESYEGKNYLSLEIAQHLTSRFLKKEKKLLSEGKGHLFILGLEMFLSKELTLLIYGKEKKLLFRGIVDRIDEFEGKKRILDYKSGKCTVNDVSINKPRGKDFSEENLVNHLFRKLKSSRYLLQLLIYNMLYYEEFKAYPDLVGIVSMVNLEESPFYLNNELTATTEELMDLFEKALVLIIEELYNPEIPFEHNVARSFCAYCMA